jgi:hypothetical protein
VGAPIASVCVILSYLVPVNAVVRKRRKWTEPRMLEYSRPMQGDFESSLKECPLFIQNSNPGIAFWELDCGKPTDSNDSTLQLHVL